MDNMKCNDICIIATPEGKESQQEIKKLFKETMTKNFLNLVQEKDTQIQETQRVPNKLDPKEPNQDTP